MYAMKQGGEWVQISQHHFRELHPEKLIPDGQLEAEGLHPVETDPRPATAWNQTSEGALIDRGGKPVWAWAVRDMTAAEMHDARAGMEMARGDFIIAAVQAGIIAPEDGVAAAKGEVPPSLATLIDALSPEQRSAAAIRWGAATRINRMDPLILAFAQSMGLTDEQLDALFA